MVRLCRHVGHLGESSWSACALPRRHLRSHPHHLLRSLHRHRPRLPLCPHRNSPGPEHRRRWQILQSRTRGLSPRHPHRSQRLALPG